MCSQSVSQLPSPVHPSSPNSPSQCWNRPSYNYHLPSTKTCQGGFLTFNSLKDAVGRKSVVTWTFVADCGIVRGRLSGLGDSQGYMWLTGMQVTHQDACDSQGCRWLIGMQVTHRDAGDSPGCRWLTGMHVTHRDAGDSLGCRWLTGMQVTHRDACDSQGCGWLIGMQVTHRDAGDSPGCRWLTVRWGVHTERDLSLWRQTVGSIESEVFQNMTPWRWACFLTFRWSHILSSVIQHPSKGTTSFTGWREFSVSAGLYH